MRRALVYAVFFLAACNTDVTPATILTCEPIRDAYVAALGESKACDLHAENPCVRYGYARPGVCECGSVTVTAATAAELDALRAQYQDAACNAQTECLVGCEPAVPTACSYRRDGNHICDESSETCSDALLEPAYATVDAFYNSLANACDDPTDCVGVSASVLRDHNYCLPGCPLGVSRADAPAFREFIATDTTLTSQCETIFQELCQPNTFSCFATALDCADHKCRTMLADPAFACSWTLTEALSQTLDDYYASLTNFCDDVSDCTSIHAPIARNGNICAYGCGFAISEADAPALLQFIANDATVTSECQSILDASCTVYARTCDYNTTACVANKCALTIP